MKALIAALERIATALEQLVPAVQQATREQRYRQSITHPVEGGTIWTLDAPFTYSDSEDK